MKHLELLDSCGVDVRPVIREFRDGKKRQFLESNGTIYMTLQEYAEHKVCGKPFNELTEVEVRQIGSSLFKELGKNPYWHLEYDADLYKLLLEIEYKIADTVEMYRESNGMCGKSKLVYRRRIDQAVRLGIDLPPDIATCW